MSRVHSAAVSYLSGSIPRFESPFAKGQTVDGTLVAETLQFPMIPVSYCGFIQEFVYNNGESQ